MALHYTAPGLPEMNPDVIILSALIGAFTSAISTLAYVARLIYTGRLVPRTTHEDAIKNATDWREVALEAYKQNNTLLEGAKVATKVAEAVVSSKEAS